MDNSNYPNNPYMVMPIQMQPMMGQPMPMEWQYPQQPQQILYQEQAENTNTNANETEEEQTEEKPKRKRKHINPSNVMDISQIPDAVLVESEDNIGNTIYMVQIGDDEFPITDFVPKVFEQLKVKMIRMQQQESEDNRHRHVQREEFVNKPVQQQNVINLNDAALAKAETKEEFSYFKPLITGWNKTFLLLILIFALLNPYTKTFISTLLPTIENELFIFAGLAVVIAILYHFITGYFFT